jgi:hypothetical protein
MNALATARQHLARAHRLLNPQMQTIPLETQLEAERHRALAHDLLELHRAELEAQPLIPLMTQMAPQSYPRVVDAPQTRRTK